MCLHVMVDLFALPTDCGKKTKLNKNPSITLFSFYSAASDGQIKTLREKNDENKNNTTLGNRCLRVETYLVR